ncbi:hypothetical protein D5018_04635 [Parashewanella curva]|uniref:Uncharacterized protein YyaB-like PH domain-containing protein n=1 Tax=Parashewanella curva TaxID=2338552 RepID=A0A3L8Q304_9GAMM|nr:PH domain-containing protein [Parashewanella curva]RLV60932.1 hypothetical protein D5018_04635 [Parashewanella curva]
MSHQKQLIFRSKVDVWLMLVLLATVVACTFGALQLAISQYSYTSVAIGLCIFLFGAVFPLWLFARTHYRIDENHHKLLIHSGPFHWHIPLDSISSIEATRNPIAGPALSLDRVIIEYGDNQFVVVSPREKGKFIKMIEQYLKPQESA